MKKILAISLLTIPLCWGMQQPIKRKSEPKKASTATPKYQKVLTEKEEATKELEQLLKESYSFFREDFFKKMRPIINKGANPNLKDRLGTPLIMTAPFSFIPPLRWILDHGADPNISDAEGKTPLIQATISHNPAKVQTLLEYDADRSLKDNAGKTALDYAIADKNLYSSSTNPWDQDIVKSANEIIALLTKQKIP